MMKRNTLFPGRSHAIAPRGVLCALALLLFLALDISAGVLVAPTVVILSDKERTGRITVQNPTNKPREVDIYFSFGLPESDSLGDVRISLQDSNVIDARSAMDWIKAFPRKILLPPNASQVVRLVASPPDSLQPGEYWARIVIRSQEGAAQLPPTGENNQITTNLNMIMQTAIMLKYRTGDLSAKLELADATVTPRDSLIEVMLNMANRGNVSYVGVLTCRLLDAAKKEISHKKIDLAVYRDMKRRINLPLLSGDFKPPYLVEVLITTEGRHDIADADMVFGNVINRTLAVP
jgi:P pilus assembly chaperone PapD